MVMRFEKKKRRARVAFGTALAIFMLALVLLTALLIRKPTKPGVTRRRAAVMLEEFDLGHGADFLRITNNDGGFPRARRLDGSIDFNRTWEEYAGGFGNLSGSFWWGLRNVHLLTTQCSGEQGLRVSMLGCNGTRAYQDYAAVRIEDEASAFRLSIDIDRTNGTAGEGFCPYDTLQGYCDDGDPFNTYDRDHDFWTTLNCAKNNGGAGWWWNKCGLNSFNGLYDSKGNCSVIGYKGIYWSSFGPHFQTSRPLAETQLKIRQLQ